MESRNRGKKQQKSGSNKHGLKLSRQDVFTKDEAYKQKYSEYSEMELPELRLLKEKVNGGVYMDALVDVIQDKKSLEDKKEKS